MAKPPLPEAVAGALKPATRRPIDKLLSPIRVFTEHKLAGAGLLMLSTLAAVLWANSPWSEAYHHMLHVDLGVELGDHLVNKTLHHWVNDGLMSIFFFFVGLEIKREVLVGELSTIRRASLPAIAALGGLVIPAVLYYLINPPETQQGWGVPMATDIAFALGVLALLGDRVPLGLRVFLTALAIVDDIGAVLVIAVMYTDNLTVGALVFGFGCIAISLLMNRLRVREAMAYCGVGIAAWFGFLESGVHATIAALLMAFTIPVRTQIDGAGLTKGLSALTEHLKNVGMPTSTGLNTPEQQHIFDRMAHLIDDASSPLARIEHGLAGFVTFLVLPVFALSNAGVHVGAGLGDALRSPMTLGIVAGLVFGKTVGIFGASWLAVKLGIADLPAKVGWIQIFGVAVLGGVGFTMALFIAGLAFDTDAQLETAKVGILCASLVAGVAGWSILRFSSRASPTKV